MLRLTFPNGDKMPALGLGTWQIAPDNCGAVIPAALSCGYRHIDCAAIYRNEAALGDALSKALARGPVGREELWLTSKLWNTAHREKDVRPALQKTLQDLQQDYLDLYLIHWPVVMTPDGSGFLTLDEVPISETWQALEACVDEGLVRHIGVANFSIRKLEALLAESRIKPVMDQVEAHPLLQQNELKTFCDEHGVHLTAYSPLGGNGARLLQLPVIREIADEHGATPAQVLISWALTRGTAVIPKSEKPAHLKDNFAAAGLRLSENDMQRIAALDEHFRFLDGSFWGGPYTPEALWDEA